MVCVYVDADFPGRGATQVYRSFNGNVRVQERSIHRVFPHQSVPLVATDGSCEECGATISAPAQLFSQTIDNFLRLFGRPYVHQNLCFRIPVLHTEFYKLFHSFLGDIGTLLSGVDMNTMELETFRCVKPVLHDFAGDLVVLIFRL
jgi:hypothetical protein